MLTLLVNVENILTDYVPRSMFFFQKKAILLDRKLPDDYIDSFLSAGHEALIHHYYRFPHFKAFSQESEQLFTAVNQQINADNHRVQQLLNLQKQLPLKNGFIYDKKKKDDFQVSDFLVESFKPVLQLYRDDAFLGKPEGNIFFKAKALANLQVKATYVLDASKNGMLSAYLANMRGLYLDQGVGINERIFKYSYMQVHTFQEVHAVLADHHQKHKKNSTL